MRSSVGRKPSNCLVLGMVTALSNRGYKKVFIDLTLPENNNKQQFLLKPFSPNHIIDQVWLSLSFQTVEGCHV